MIILKKNEKLINILKNAIRHKKGDDDFAYVSEVGSYLKNQNSINAKKFGNFKTWGGEIFKQLHNIFEIKMLEKKWKKKYYG